VATTILRYFGGGLRTAATVLAVHPVGEFEDDDRPCVILSETVLQHETTDRVADLGTIDGVPVVRVARTPGGDVRHHFDGPAGRFGVGRSSASPRPPSCGAGSPGCSAPAG
jgi:hypothetical protein